MILTRDGKEITAIYRPDGSEIEEVKDASGRIVYSASKEITGTLPLYFFSRGKPLTDYLISGETLQDGTPSPDAPVDVVGCGVKTGNLFDKSATNTNNGYISKGYLISDGTVITNNAYRVSEYIAVSPNQSYTLYYGATLYTPSVCFYDSSKNFISGIAYKGSRTVLFSTPQNAAFLKLSFTVQSKDTVMLNYGSTALPYEPYGYKLPVTTTNRTDTVTTPVYIGAEPLHRIGEYADYVDYSSGKIVRRIKKLVLTGEENWRKNSNGSTAYISPVVPEAMWVHALKMLIVSDRYQTARSQGDLYNRLIDYGTSFGSSNANFIHIRDIRYDNDIEGFKTYLQQQYAAGTPVTVWYALSEPTEEEPPVPFPELQTLSGTNTLTVDATVKPSEIDLTGRIKTSGYGQLLDVNDVAIQDKNGTPIFIRG